MNAPSSPRPKRRSLRLGLALHISVGLIFLAAAVAAVVLVRGSMRRQALTEAEAKARIILERNLATHTYFSHQLKPALLTWIDTFQSDAYDPVWMSSTYAVREIDEYFHTLNPAPYYYKEFAVNARNPENEADEFERAFIKRLNADPELTHASLVRTLDGQPTFVTLQRGEVIEEACLRCHSTPDAAPADMVAAYGPERSFGREVGEVVSAISIRIPLAEAYANADRLSLNLSLVLSALLVGLFVAQSALTRRLFVSPVERIRREAVEIAADPHRLGAHIPLPPGRELQELTAALNTMSDSLARSHAELEARVEERTTHLQASNARLEEEIALRGKAEATLRESEQRYRTIFETSGTAMLISEADTTLALVNAQFERLSGYTRSELEGRRTWGEFVAPADLERLRTYHHLRRTNPGSAPSEYEFRFVDRQGHERAILASIGMIPGTDRSVASLLDITERHRLQAALEAHSDRLEQMVRERTAALQAAQEQLVRREKLAVLGHLAGGISHELRGPLGNIRNSAYYLSMAMPDPDPNIKETFDILEHEVARADSIIHSLLSFARTRTPIVKPADLNALVEIALGQVEYIAGVEVVCNLDATLPPVPADAEQLTSVVRNLATNAIQAMGNGGTLTVATTRAPSADGTAGVRLTVSDTGVGIAAEDLERIFEPLYSTKPGGVGLGLSLTQTIVEAHSGTITAESVLGQGTTFTVTLPVEPQPHPG